MKSNQKRNEQALQTPLYIQQHCGFDDAETLSVKAADGVCVIHKGELKAVELINVIVALSDLASEMTVHLAKTCGICDNCGEQADPAPNSRTKAHAVIDCSTCDGSDCNTECTEACAYLNGCKDGPADWVANCSLCRDLLDESQNIHIPDYLLEEAGIPKNAKLEAYADEDSGEITVVEADIQQDISDVPPGILSVLAASDVCLAELDDLIMLEEIVYGK